MLFFSPELKCWFHSDHLEVPIPNTTLACSIERATAEGNVDEIDWASLSEYKTRFQMSRVGIADIDAETVSLIQSTLELQLLRIEYLFAAYSVELSGRNTFPLDDEVKARVCAVSDFVQAKQAFFTKLRESGWSDEDAKELATVCLNATSLEDLED